MKGNQDDQEKVLSSFQRERLATRKKQAVETKQTWNALFLGSNAVAETLVENYDVEKRHLLLDDGENRFFFIFEKNFQVEKYSAAVRVAMGETQLVRETRKFLLDCGVKLDAFSRPLEGVKRSKTVILVKNLSAKPNERDHLQNIFARYGDVKNVIMPPGKAIYL
jgi:multiple RNA-binding domain-containing protein 1